MRRTIKKKKNNNSHPKIVFFIIILLLIVASFSINSIFSEPDREFSTEEVIYEAPLVVDDQQLEVSNITSSQDNVLELAGGIMKIMFWMLGLTTFLAIINSFRRVI